MKRKVKHFPDELKYKVVQEYLETGLSQEEIKKKYQIGGNSCISNWMRKFGLKEPDEKQKEIRQAMTKETGKTPHEQELEKKINELEKLLEHEKLRTMALNTMIDIAEKELKISIRKKSGAKR